MNKTYFSLGLMSGTSMDGVDASIIQSDGEKEYKAVIDKYFEYPRDIYENLVKFRYKIKITKDLKKFSKELSIIEKEITLFHGETANEILRLSNIDIDFIGFHGQTVFHNPNEKITKQLGDGKLLSKLTKKKVVYDFRKNDLKNRGQGAPLTPIFHNLLANQISENYEFEFPISILNIGGISNITNTIDKKNALKTQLYAYDIGPGNCLIDEWIRKKSKKKYDADGLIANLGSTDKLILKKALKNFNIRSYDKSFDTKDFDISFAKDLSLKDGASTLTDFTAELIAKGIRYSNKADYPKFTKWLVCGGGRKNKYLIDSIINKGFNYLKSISLEPIDKYGIDGDFVESQAFAYLAIRSFLNLPISFPSTTGVKKPCTGGVIVKY